MNVVRVTWSTALYCQRGSEMQEVAGHSDAYLPILRKRWDALTCMYVAFEDRAAMLEFDVVTGQIRAYPARDYLAELSGRTREETKKQYKKAVAEGALMVFVRDASKEILRSYIFALAKDSPCGGDAKRAEPALPTGAGGGAVEGQPWHEGRHLRHLRRVARDLFQASTQAWRESPFEADVLHVVDERSAGHHRRNRTHLRH